MPKILIIETCNDCINFDNQYYGWNHTCRLLKRVITESTTTDKFDIPDDCPLDDVEIK